jgi:AAA-like domain
MPNFDFKEAVKVANQALQSTENRHLSDVEIMILEGAWNRLEYDQIAAQQQYATSYISQDVAPKLWKLLSEALGEKVKKSNFREALKRRWENQPLTSSHEPISSTSISNRATLHLESNQTEFYLDRPPIESICGDTLLQPGALIRIKAPKLMGKTMLINQVLRVINQNYDWRSVNLSLELADRRTHLTDLDRFLRWFCLNLSRELNLPNCIDDYWDEAGMGSKVSCTTYVEDYLLNQDDRPLILCLDNVDLLFPHPEVYEDFFGLLRSWYEKARSRANWKKLRLVISHSTDVYIRLNINQSPFNVGLPIELPEFTAEQVQKLAQHYSLDWSLPQVVNLMEWVGGHPYLLEQAFSYLKGRAADAIGQLIQEAPSDVGIYSNHLREYWSNLQQYTELADALKQIVNATEPLPLAPVLTHQLYSLGLIVVTSAGAAPRCQLYRQYFQSRLGAS